MNCEVNRLTRVNPYKTDNYWESLKLNTIGMFDVGRVSQSLQHRELVGRLTSRSPGARLRVDDALKHHLLTEDNMEGKSLHRLGNVTERSALQPQMYSIARAMTVYGKENQRHLDQVKRYDLQRQTTLHCQAQPPVTSEPKDLQPRTSILMLKDITAGQRNSVNLVQYNQTLAENNFLKFNLQRNATVCEFLDHPVASPPIVTKTQVTGPQTERRYVFPLNRFHQTYTVLPR